MKRALIVGIDEYPEYPLSGCVNDAKSMEQILSKNQDGSPNFHCKLLVAPQDSIKRHDLRENIEELFSNDADMAFFYFAGHGAITDMGGYLVTQDTRSYDEGVAMSDVLTQANKARVREVVIVLDCCFGGGFGQIPAIGTGHAFLREGVSILTASRSYQPAKEDKGRGVFTSLVCEALNGGADDILGNVTVAAVYAYVDQTLGAWDQRPMFKSHVSRLLPLRKCKPEIDPAILRLLPQYFKTPDEEYPLDPSYEPELRPKNKAHEEIFSNFRKYLGVRLLVPVGEEYMYYAAKNSKSCKLTPLGQFYWHLAKKGKL